LYALASGGLECHDIESFRSPEGVSSDEWGTFEGAATGAATVKERLKSQRANEEDDEDDEDDEGDEGNEGNEGDKGDKGDKGDEGDGKLLGIIMGSNGEGWTVSSEFTFNLKLKVAERNSSTSSSTVR
jgi:hypothetical protein